MPKKKVEKPFNLVEWLEGLDVGAEVKIGDCSNNSCSCEYYKIAGRVPMFGSYALTVNEGCTVRYFDPLNGKELGYRKGSYKSGYLAPVTANDRAYKERNERIKATRKEWKELSNSLETKLSKLERLLENCQKGEYSHPWKDKNNEAYERYNSYSVSRTIEWYASEAKLDEVIAILEANGVKAL